jgi:hypothetical protein
LAKALDKSSNDGSQEEHFAEVVGALSNSPHEASAHHSTLHTLVDGLFNRVLCANALSSFTRLKRRMPETDVILTEDQESGPDDKSCFDICFDLSMIILGMFVCSGNSNKAVTN